MSAPIEKIVNRLREVDGNKFVKIHQGLIDAQAKHDLIVEEMNLEMAKKESSLATMQLLRARKIMALQEINTERKKLKEG